MTEEELRQEAEEWLRSTDNHLNEEKTHFLSESEYAERAYLAGAEPREKQIAELEAQIEKMKNCKNCKKLKKEKDGLLFCTVGSFYTNAFGKNCDKWEIKENDKRRT